MLGKAYVVYFYCCLLNNIANAIIKATFMIVTPTNPKNSKLIVNFNIDIDISTISTTSYVNLITRGYGKGGNTHICFYLISYVLHYIIFTYKFQANKTNFFIILIRF